jgi:hypothetical protein
MLHPDTPVTLGGLTIWEREIAEATKAIDSIKVSLSQAEYRLAHAKAYLEELKQALENQKK